jgi:hypothetical protein
MKEGIERTSWLLFNDFAISPVSAFEAIHYNPAWKVCLSKAAVFADHSSDAVRNVLQEASNAVECEHRCEAANFSLSESSHNRSILGARHQVIISL